MYWPYIRIPHSHCPRTKWASDGQFYYICELSLGYYKAVAEKRKMTAEIMKLDFNPHFKNILVQIGHGNFKGKSKAKAADKILA